MLKMTRPDSLPTGPQSKRWDKSILRVINKASTIDLAVPFHPTTQFHEARGTAFYVSFFVLATCYHVIADAIQIFLVTDVDNSVTHHRAALIYACPNIDLALLYIKEPGMPLTIATDEVIQEGDVLVARGFPLGTSKIHTNKGVVSQKKDSEMDHLMVYDAPVNAGQSGAPLFDKNDIVVGMVSMGRKEANSISYGVPSFYIRQAISEFLSFTFQKDIRLENEWASFDSRVLDQQAQKHVKNMLLLLKPSEEFLLQRGSDMLLGARRIKFDEKFWRQLQVRESTVAAAKKLPVEPPPDYWARVSGAAAAVALDRDKAARRNVQSRPKNCARQTVRVTFKDIAGNKETRGNPSRKPHKGRALQTLHWNMDEDNDSTSTTDSADDLGFLSDSNPDAFERPVEPRDEQPVDRENLDMEMRDLMNRTLTEHRQLRERLYGVLVRTVVENSGAHKAGLEHGDLIFSISAKKMDRDGTSTFSIEPKKISIDGEVLDHPKPGECLKISTYFLNLRVGDVVSVGVLQQKDGKLRTLQFPATSARLMALPQLYFEVDKIDYEVFAGLVLEDLALNHAELFNIDNFFELKKAYQVKNRNKPQVLIINVLPSSFFACVRTVYPGYLLMAINGIQVRTLAGVREALLAVIENDQEEYFTFELAGGAVATIHKVIVARQDAYMQQQHGFKPSVLTELLTEKTKDWKFEIQNDCANTDF
jgi:S1-C subfamily serine protease